MRVMSKSPCFLKTSIIVLTLSSPIVLILSSLLQLRDIMPILIASVFPVHFFLWKRKLKSYGIWSIDAPHTSLNMNLQLQNCQNSFDFLGVSARTILDARGSQTIKKKIAETPNVKIRFLLLDPNEDEIGEQRAKDETGNIRDWIAWKKIISASIDELKNLKKEITTANIEVRVYKEFPVFRSITVDENFMYINYYGKGFRPSETPNLALRKKSISLFNAFESNFDRVWNPSTVIL